MDLKNIIITPDTDEALIPFIRAYQPHTMVPARRDLLEAEYYEAEVYNISGHCTLKGLALQAGFDSDDYVNQIREAEMMMARAMDTDE